MAHEDTIGVIGAGVIGSSIACALARAGRRVLLIDRAPPGEGGASFGNAGHIATELLEPLPSPGLLFGFWRLLTAFDGPLHIPARRLPDLAPWAARFAGAAFRRRANTAHLAPFVRPAVDALETLLRDIGRSDLLKRHGHYEIWLNRGAARRAAAQARLMERLEVPTAPAPAELLVAARTAAHATDSAGLWFPKCAHVVDPLEVVRAFAHAAAEQGAGIARRQVRELVVRGGVIEIASGSESVVVGSVVVCAGAWSAPLLRPFGLTVPLEAARGYHVEMPGAKPLIDAPVLYQDQSTFVTPMAGRLRSTSFMEFDSVDAPPDSRRPSQLQRTLISLGYPADTLRASWVGPRPVLPDYLPAMGRVSGAPNIFYAFAHQHIGLTLSAMTANIMADMVAGRPLPAHVAAFDLQRFS
ncbi:MAG TPA: FAD-binding oxidoreductase [Steroidobacteraceae bacterium]|jgi:D-amino-acid dehydrogenase|nr:FAD-binding oxidoreductase [Steroidobacteraceae bacterium]